MYNTEDILCQAFLLFKCLFNLAFNKEKAIKIQNYVTQVLSCLWDGEREPRAVVSLQDVTFVIQLTLLSRATYNDQGPARRKPGREGRLRFAPFPKKGSVGAAFSFSRAARRLVVLLKVLG